MPPGQKLVSYDVSALFTSRVPVDQALTIIREKLHEDTTLKQRCQLDVEQVIELLGLCLNTTYFMHNNKFYQQTHRAAMGSPASIPHSVQSLHGEFREDSVVICTKAPLDVAQICGRYVCEET